MTVERCAVRSAWVVGWLGALLLVGVGVAACGGAPPPTDQLATSQAAIRGASEAGAEADPRAKKHLQLAERQLEEAKALIEDDDNEAALLMLQRAEADAELARALAKKSETSAQAVEALTEVKKLEEKTK
jgi:signal transduction histidine kinase